jgi:hypothetical protein
MKCVLIGSKGQIGQAIYNVYSNVHLIDCVDIDYEAREFEEYDVMLVTIPYSDNFIEIVSEYQQKFKAKAKIIFSTVAVGTTSKLKDAVHVPIEGKHPDLTTSISKWQVFIGGYNRIAYDFFVQAGKLPYVLEASEHTEFLKLQSTTNYGLMIEYARYVNDVCKGIGMEFSKVNAYNGCYNALYSDMGMPQYCRYILIPPEGKKGGHCITSNANILRNQFRSKLVDIVAEVNLNE